MVAAQLLLFGCVMHGKGSAADVLQLMSSSAAAKHLDSPEMCFAVRVVKTLATGDFFSFLRAELGAPTPLLAALVQLRTLQVRLTSLKPASPPGRP